jgi:hypothetical protein
MRVPKKIQCRICGDKFLNPLSKGAKVVMNTCEACRLAMFSKKALRRIERDKKKVINDTVKETKQHQPNVNKDEQPVQSSEQPKGYTTLYSFSQTRDT